MTLTRRQLLRAGAATGALLVARPAGTLQRALGAEPVPGAARRSRLFPEYTLVHADLHNHSLFSDGAGDPELAFGSMRAAGLDVAALTDHSTVSYGLPDSVCPNSDCQSVAGIDEDSWARTKDLADQASRESSFVAIRGFEWSSPTLGHINVWFSERWIDPLHTAGTTTGEGAAQFIHQDAPGGSTIAPALDELVNAAPTTGTGMRLFYDWLAADSGRPALGGGLDGLAGFNHPGRETGRFSYFSADPAVRDRLVSMEIFNRREDYLFEGTDAGQPSPLPQCLDAGWRVGLLGVTDEHGTDWGFPEGKGRGGLWVRGLTRSDVRAAMVERRFFATRVSGLRLDASGNNRRMGSEVPVGRLAVRFRLDVDAGPSWWGKRLSVQVLGPGSPMPTILHEREFRVRSPREPVLSFRMPLDPGDVPWVVLRVADPALPADGRADPTWAQYGEAVAYSSPFYLVPR
ncbi:MAG: CehA/McbA family metallohydrolase [Actinomycetota bacterium]